MYSLYIDQMKSERSALRKIAVSDHFYSDDSDSNPLNNSYVQWCFFDKIFSARVWSDDDEIRQYFEEWKKTHNYRGEQPVFAQSYMYSGSSSGTPWTQYCFWERVRRAEDIADDNRPNLHSLFWRLDPWQISLRYYVNCGMKHPEQDDKLRELRNMRPEKSGWERVERHATYEFALLEHKFSPEDKFEDIRKQVLEIHRVFQSMV